MKIKSVTVFGSGVLGAQPMAMADLVGMTTAYNVTNSYAELTDEDIWKERRDFLKQNFIDQNKLGITTGEGFIPTQTQPIKMPIS
ncbi:3-hydroxyacyl-CoA dehydrogenase family protein [Epilithonimonas sp. UC225_85]|uniref:3-hydroxyacyl-CoA dehydrogenase family protein n=1 Tax=Epilithonimonas sp. UC225_85 TaxID=3350167 RepID=UPI0036D37F83